MTEINIQIRDADTFECQGKTYRAVAFRVPTLYELYTTGDEPHVFRCHCHSYSTLRLIVEEVKPLHRTPTDEDALRRPRCEYRDHDTQPWLADLSAKLVYVCQTGTFWVRHDDGSVCAWLQCRIPNET